MDSEVCTGLGAAGGPPNAILMEAQLNPQELKFPRWESWRKAVGNEPQLAPGTCPSLLSSGPVHVLLPHHEDTPSLNGPRRARGSGRPCAGDGAVLGVQLFLELTHSDNHLHHTTVFVNSERVPPTH